jgi:hypothetical protein
VIRHAIGSRYDRLAITDTLCTSDERFALVFRYGAGPTVVVRTRYDGNELFPGVRAGKRYSKPPAGLAGQHS